MPHHSRLRRALYSACLALLLAVASSDAQTTFIETFDGGSNEGGWWYGIPNPPIELSGGNPGAYLHEPALDTFAPMGRTTSATSEFTGDYLSRGVSAIGIDLITFATDFGAGGRPLALMLLSGNLAVYTLGANVPLDNQGWIAYDFVVPTTAPTLPVGWFTLDLDTGLPEPSAWPNVLLAVDEVRYFYGDPTFFFIFQFWNIGLDNPRITTAGIAGDVFLRGDINGDGSRGLADAIVGLSALFAGGAPLGCLKAADVNDDGNVALNDMILLLSHLFSTTSPPIPEPFAGCDVDPTPDALDCLTLPTCL